MKEIAFFIFLFFFIMRVIFKIFFLLLRVLVRFLWFFLKIKIWFLVSVGIWIWCEMVKICEWLFKVLRVLEIVKFSLLFRLEFILFNINMFLKFFKNFIFKSMNVNFKWLYFLEFKVFNWEFCKFKMSFWAFFLFMGVSFKIKLGFFRSKFFVLAFKRVLKLVKYFFLKLFISLYNFKYLVFNCFIFLW